MSNRVHMKPTLSLWPLRRMRWRWRDGYRGTSGYRWFLFGIIPVWSRRDR